MCSPYGTNADWDFVFLPIFSPYGTIVLCCFFYQYLVVLDNFFILFFYEYLVLWDNCIILIPMGQLFDVNFVF